MKIIKHPFPVGIGLTRENFNLQKLEEFIKKEFSSLPKLLAKDIATCWFIWGNPGNTEGIKPTDVIPLSVEKLLPDNAKKIVMDISFASFAAMHDTNFIIEKLEDIYDGNLFDAKAENIDELITIMDTMTFELCENIDYHRDEGDGYLKPYYVVVILGKTIYFPIDRKWFPAELLMYLQDNDTSF